jgi:hypothetical protein
VVTFVRCKNNPQQTTTSLSTDPKNACCGRGSEHFMACQAYQDCHEFSSRSIRPCLGSKRFGQARRMSSGNRRASGLFFPAEIRADVGASLAANLAGE